MVLRIAVLVALVTALSAKASAQRHTIEIDPCVGVPVSEVTRILHLEFLDGPSHDTERNVHVHIECDGALIAVHLREASTGWSLHRRFELGDSSRGRARHLALEVAELSAVAFRPAEENRTRRLNESRVELTPPLKLGVTGILEVRGSPSVVQGGGGIFVTHNWLHWIGGFLDGTLVSGATDVDFGSVQATTAAASLGVFVDPTSGPVSLRFGLGARFESTWLSGDPARPEQVTGLAHHGFSWGALARVGLDYAITSRVTFGLRIEGGWTAIPVRGLARDAEVLAIEGPWIRTSAGVALGLGG